MFVYFIYLLLIHVFYYFKTLRYLDENDPEIFPQNKTKRSNILYLYITFF